MSGESIKVRLRGMPGYGKLKLLYHVMRGGDLRHSALLRMWRTEGLFQPFGDTGDDRYPVIFRAVLDRLGDGPDRRLLSFGCATGEEVFTLRTYFPQACIRGLDISGPRIAVCRTRLRRSGDARLSFIRAGSAAAEETGSCDAVFAMAVFRHGDLGSRPPRCDHRIRFADFDREIGELARCLKPDGLLAIRHAHFRFADTAAAAGFESILDGPRHRDNHFYGPDNCLAPQSVQEGVLFRKRLC